MEKIFLLLILFCAFVKMSFSQKEAYHWYFGEGAGLDFSSSSLALDPNGLMKASHGSAVISDKNGNLLFYTNGTLVWNKNHEIMPNGLLSDSCAGIHTMQNCAIVPKIGEENKFYIFTVQTINSGNKGLRYNIVDMSKDNNYGDITKTSIPVVDSLLVGCTVTRHANEIDYWVVVKGITLISNVWHEKWLSYLIDENGVNLASTYLGSPVDIFITAQSGKFSPNGKFLYWGEKVFDFDNTSGEILNYRRLVQFSSMYTNGEFSPNSNVIYVTNHGSTAFSLDQFDLNSSNLIDSKISIDIETDNIRYIKGGLQLAPDGKIYVSYLDNIGVINNPNALGTDCQLEQNKINVPGQAKWCFPNFSSHLFENSLTTDTEEYKNANYSLKVFPNPAKEFIKIHQSEKKYTKYELMNANAILIQKNEIISNNFNLDVSNIPQGLFLLKLSSEDSFIIKKVFIR